MTVQKTDEQWRDELSREEYKVLREAGTEAPFTGKYTDTETEGVYRCRACDAVLFTSDTKFHSGCGWPSFADVETAAVTLLADSSLGRERTEVRCANCDSHLGHVFYGEGFTEENTRFCINSVSLVLEPKN